jgi:hypothetical protein
MDTNEPRESVYDEDGEAEAPDDEPVGQAEPAEAEPEAPVELPTTSTDPPASS